MIVVIHGAVWTPTRKGLKRSCAGCLPCCLKRDRGSQVFPVRVDHAVDDRELQMSNALNLFCPQQIDVSSPFCPPRSAPAAASVRQTQYQRAAAPEPDLLCFDIGAELVASHSAALRDFECLSSAFDIVVKLSFLGHYLPLQGSTKVAQYQRAIDFFRALAKGIGALNESQKHALARDFDSVRSTVLNLWSIIASSKKQVSPMIHHPSSLDWDAVDLAPTPERTKKHMGNATAFWKIDWLSFQPGTPWQFADDQAGCWATDRQPNTAVIELVCARVAASMNCLYPFLVVDGASSVPESGSGLSMTFYWIRRLRQVGISGWKVRKNTEQFLTHAFREFCFKRVSLSLEWQNSRLKCCPE